MLNNTPQEENNSEKGFTLAELLVAMSVFVVATAMISGIFVRTVRTQRQTNHLMTLNSDAALVLERITREVREGFNFTEPSSSGNCSDALTFSRNINGVETEISYRINNQNIERSQGGGDYTPLNSSNVEVRDLCFLKTQSTSDDPWRITVAIESGSTDQNINYAANLQTTITARSLPCEVSGDTCAY